MNSAGRIVVSIGKQQLRLLQGQQLIARYAISTAKKGIGQEEGSGCTPLGEHVVRLKIGESCPENTVFVGRRPTGEVFSTALQSLHPDRDWILTRILWLSGREPGLNRGGRQDTLRRYIYIHGCPDSEPMGVPLSHGCIRMRNSDMVDLFGQTFNGMPVSIEA